MRGIIFATALFFFNLTHSQAILPLPGEAPDFTLTGHDGKTYELKNLKGKTVVLEWYNNDCPYVEKHYDSGNMQGLQKKFTDKGVVWLSVISSAPGKQGFVDKAQAKKLILERKSSPVAILLDPSGKVGRLYDAKTTPHMFIIDKNGNLVYQGGIDDKPSAKQESLKGATPYFANAMNNILEGKKVDVAVTKPYGCSVKY